MFAAAVSGWHTFPNPLRSRSELSSLRRRASLIGFRALGEHGELGVVESEGGDDGCLSLVVRGGVSSALVYLVPCDHVAEIGLDRRTVLLDVDVQDFLPSLRPDGTVELRLPS
jgi:hypothetical protein